MQLLDGLALSKTIKSEIKQIVSDRVDLGFKRPHLAAVLIGENGASVTYVNAKVKSCEEVGFDSTLVQLKEDSTEEEVLQCMDDLLDVGCQVFTIGQYLQPTVKHIPVLEYVHPDTFEMYKNIGLEKGFKHIESSPLVRSSYHAERHIFDI